MEDTVIVYHGTSTAFEDSIAEHGFLPKPERRASHDASAGAHTGSFDGTYVATDSDSSGYYARMAVKHYGGEPVIYVLRVPLSAMVPDEDEVHYSLSYPLACVLGFNDADEDGEQKATREWSFELAREAVDLVAECFTIGEQSRDAVAKELHALVGKAIGDDWDRDLWLFHPDGNDMGWASPNWVRRLCATPEGMAFYREKMDAMLRRMAGADPEDFPAGFESFKGRIFDGFKLDGNDNGVTVIGYGSPGNPFDMYEDLSSLDGNEMALYPETLKRPAAAADMAMA